MGIKQRRKIVIIQTGNSCTLVNSMQRSKISRAWHLPCHRRYIYFERNHWNCKLIWQSRVYVTTTIRKISHFSCSTVKSGARKSNAHRTHTRTRNSFHWFRACIGRDMNLLRIRCSDSGESYVWRLLLFLFVLCPFTQNKWTEAPAVRPICIHMERE